MSANNARIIEKDLMAEVPPTSAGVSPVIDLFGSSGGSFRYSCQAVYDVQSPAAKSFTDTDVNVEDNEVTVTDHGFTTGFKVQLTTDGTLPAPLMTSTNYFIIVVDEDTLQFASSLSDALDGTPIVLEDEGSEGAENTITGVTLAGASITFQESNDGENWSDVQAATSIATDGSVILKQIAYCRYFRAVKALTSGQVALIANLLAIGDAS